MSDFGTIIIATKINSTGSEQEITATDEENLTEVLAKLISHFHTLNAEGDLMNAQFEITEKNVAIAPLSDHYFNDEDWEDQYVFVSNNEEDYAELLVQELIRIFPEFKFETKLEKW
jgi:hypothetical protein